MKSPMVHQFSRVPAAEIQRSSFNRSCGHKTTFDAGWLVPVFVDEALPGDTFNLDMTAFCRLATPLHPFMDNLFIDSFFFAVPERLVWSNWEKFNGAQANPADSTSFVMPTVVGPTTGYAVNSLQDYMGLPTATTAAVTHRADFLRAYNLIWNEWFRDQNLQNSVTVPLTDGPDANNLYTLLRRGKRHDYFTSCLPWPQKGPAVALPLTGNAPVTGIGKVTTGFPNTNVTVYETDSPGTLVYPFAAPAEAANDFKVKGSAARPQIYANLAAVTAATINSLRQAFQVQRLYERDARGGTRYTEIVKAHFGVTSPDARLNRPEYLGGGSSPVSITPIAQTSGTGIAAQPTPQGNLAGMGTATIRKHGFTKSFTEHCIILGLVSVRADLSYQQGLDRMWNRSTRFDFYWPALSHIGEQAVLNKEIFVKGDANDVLVFGYQERWAEYRYKPSKITGQFRSTAATPLDTWHLAQSFATLPVLNAAFIVDDPPIDRVIAVVTEPHFLFDGYFSLKCARPMPMYSVPGMIDHF